MQKSSKFPKRDWVYWFKIAFGIFTAALTTILDIRDWQGLVFGISMLVVAHYLSRFVLGINLSEFDNSEFKMFASGAITYFITFLVFWALFFSFWAM